MGFDIWEGVTMDWYYVESGQRVGPVDDAEIERLAGAGAVTDDTLVWHAGMAEWQPYATARSAGTESAQPIIQAEEGYCCECGRRFFRNQMIRYTDSWVCAECKPRFFQRVKEGAVLPGTMVYGGFWIRFVAKVVDGIIVGVVNQLLMVVLGSAIGSSQEPTAFFVVWLLSMALPAVYTTFFLGKYGATLGKMACGLKVVTADGGKVSYGRALGRHLAEILSSLILLIGYIMAAFDEQKRTLHDHICNTRVIKTR